ncbi:MAG: CHRD domain-containing protein [Polaromonas sp.]
MTARRQAIRFSVAAFAVVAAAAITGCGMMKPSSMPSPSASSTQAAQSNLVAFSTQMRASSEVPPNASQGSGMVDAVFDKNTNQLRWKASYSGLSGPATMAHFHGPAAAGVNAGVVVPWPSPVTSPLEGSATLTAAQAADLMAGRWYANVHTAAHPGGEIRGQMMPRY